MNLNEKNEENIWVYYVLFYQSENAIFKSVDPTEMVLKLAKKERNLRC